MIFNNRRKTLTPLEASKGSVGWKSCPLSIFRYVEQDANELHVTQAQNVPQAYFHAKS
jgi:hypothetical protein